MTSPSNPLPDYYKTLPIDNVFLFPAQQTLLQPNKLDNERLQKQIEEMKAWIRQSEAKPKRTLKDEVEKIFVQKNNEMMNNLTSLVHSVNAAASQLRLACQTSGLQLRKQQAGWDDVEECYAGWTKFQLLKEMKNKSKPKPPPPGMYL